MCLIVVEQVPDRCSLAALNVGGIDLVATLLDVGLAILHRFGVHHRLILRHASPNLLLELHDGLDVLDGAHPAPAGSRRPEASCRLAAPRVVRLDRAPTPSPAGRSQARAAWRR